MNKELLKYLRAKNPDRDDLTDEEIYQLALSLNPDLEKTFKVEQKQEPTATSTELRRQALEPTPEEYDKMTLGEKAGFYARKKGIDPERAYQIVSGSPYQSKLQLFNEDPTLMQEMGRSLNDMLSSIGGRELYEDPSKISGQTGVLLRDIHTSPEAVGTALTAPITGTLGGIKGFLPRLGAIAATETGVDIGVKKARGEDVTGGDVALSAVGSITPDLLAEGTKGLGIPLLKNLFSSSVSKEALERASTGAGREALKQSANKANEIGQELIQGIKKIEGDPMIKEALEKMPEVDMNPVVNALEDAKIKPTGNRPLRDWEKQANQMIDDEILNLLENPTLSAKGAFEYRKALDADIDPMTLGVGGEDIANAYNKALQKGRKEIQQGLIRASKGTDYAPRMEDLAKKLQAREEVFAKLNIPRNQLKAENSAERIVYNLYGANKTEAQNALKKYDELFGTDYLNRTKDVSLAKDIGITAEGNIPFIKETTGKALLAPITSPALTSRYYQGMNLLGGGIDRLQKTGLQAPIGVNIANIANPRSFYGFDQFEDEK